MAPVRFSAIDASNRGDHSRLTEDDECYYLFEYTSRRGFEFGPTNQLISNLKKSVSRRGRPDYRYKAQAIRKCSEYFREAINDDWLQSGTLVPIPPSKMPGDPLYDPRVTEICRGITKPNPVDVRDLVRQTRSIQAAHESDDRPSAEDLLGIYQIDPALTKPPPQAIGVVDDVLTAGTHFRAVKTVLSDAFPGLRVVGLFIARRVFPDDEATEILDLFETL